MIMVFAMILTHRRHGTLSLLWATYSPLPDLGFKPHVWVYLSVFLVWYHLLLMPPKAARVTGDVLDLCVHSSHHFTVSQIGHSIPSTGILQHVRQSSRKWTHFLQGHKDFWDCCSAIPRALPIDTRCCFYSNGNAVLSKVGLKPDLRRDIHTLNEWYYSYCSTHASLPNPLLVIVVMRSAGNIKKFRILIIHWLQPKEFKGSCDWMLCYSVFTLYNSER